MVPCLLDCKKSLLNLVEILFSQLLIYRISRKESKRPLGYLADALGMFSRKISRRVHHDCRCDKCL